MKFFEQDLLAVSGLLVLYDCFSNAFSGVWTSLVVMVGSPQIKNKPSAMSPHKFLQFPSNLNQNTVTARQNLLLLSVIKVNPPDQTNKKAYEI